VGCSLTEVGLRLSPEKTQAVHIDEGFDFLGFHIRQMRKRGTQKHHVYTMPSKISNRSIKDKVRAKTYRSTRQSNLRELLISLNQTLRGWAKYFRYGVSEDVFGAVDSYAWRRIASWLAANTPDSAGSRCAAHSASREPGRSPTTGTRSPAPPASP
jgi:RNA-directed DNA polymerase